MDMEIVTLIVSSLFGATGIVTLLLAKRERRANASLVEANANLEMQKGYAQFVIDTNNIIRDLKIEVKDIKYELQLYKMQCRECSNNKINRV